MSQEQAGEGYQALWMATEDDLIEIYTLEKAAKTMNYTKKYIGALCGEGKLIATKISGRYFPHRDACELFGREPLEDIPL